MSPLAKLSRVLENRLALDCWQPTCFTSNVYLREAEASPEIVEMLRQFSPSPHIVSTLVNEILLEDSRRCV